MSRLDFKVKITVPCFFFCSLDCSIPLTSTFLFEINSHFSSSTFVDHWAQKLKHNLTFQVQPLASYNLSPLTIGQGRCSLHINFQYTLGPGPPPHLKLRNKDNLPQHIVCKMNKNLYNIHILGIGFMFVFSAFITAGFIAAIVLKDFDRNGIDSKTGNL